MFAPLAAYGTLELSGKAMTIIVIVSVCMLALTTLLYIMENIPTGTAIHFVAFALMTVFTINWWTFVDWNAGGPFPAVGGAILLIATAAGPPAIARLDT